MTRVVITLVILSNRMFYVVFPDRESSRQPGGTTGVIRVDAKKSNSVSVTSQVERLCGVATDGEWREVRRQRTVRTWPI